MERSTISAHVLYLYRISNPLIFDLICSVNLLHKHHLTLNSKTRGGRETLMKRPASRSLDPMTSFTPLHLKLILSPSSTKSKHQHQAPPLLFYHAQLILFPSLSPNTIFHNYLPPTTMTESEDLQTSKAYLTSLLNRNLRVHTTDSRMFLGQFKCTDSVFLPFSFPSILRTTISHSNFNLTPPLGSKHRPRPRLRIPDPTSPQNRPIHRIYRRCSYRKRKRELYEESNEGYGKSIPRSDRRARRARGESRS